MTSPPCFRPYDPSPEARPLDEDLDKPSLPAAAPPLPLLLAPPGVGLKWGLAALALVWAALSVALARPDAPAFVDAQRDLLGILVGWPIALGETVLVVLWLFAAWRTVPPSNALRWDYGNDVLRMFFPLYAIFRVVSLQQHLCAALDASLADAGENGRAPTALGFAAPFVTLAGLGLAFLAPERIAFLAVAATHAVWFLFLYECDRTRVAVVEARDRAYRRILEGGSVSND
ncbi:MAG TPA: hypothetical protein VGI39_40100 [Polyangiaceae bacterium]